jgi:uncharacterized DUF497 family protein
MDISFDPYKDRLNQKKHGVSLAEAAKVDWGEALEQLDDRCDYGEERYKALVFIDGLLYSVIYVDRGGSRRIISLRKANRREYADYGRTY